ncbi:MAG: HEAT repeat domain-containing protein, partial [Planctomycetota bacterium]
MKDPVGPVRRAALFALGQIGGSGSVVFLRDALPAMEEADVPYALEALGKTGDARAVPLATRRLGGGTPEMRGAAALALVRLAAPSALPELFAALASESDAETRWRMLCAAWRLLRARGPAGPPAEWMELLAAATAASRPFEERVFAIRALGALGTRPPRLFDLLDETDARLCVEAVHASSLPWDGEAAGAALARAPRSEPLVQEALLEMLRAGGAAARPLLEGFHEPVSAPLRLRALHAEILAAAGGTPEWFQGASAEERATAWYEEALWRGSARAGRIPKEGLPATFRGRAAAAEACAVENAPVEAARSTLRELLGTPDFAVRAAAIKALALRGEPADADAIVAAAEQARDAGEMEVRAEAASALAALKAAHPWLGRAATEDP